MRFTKNLSKVLQRLHFSQNTTTDLDSPHIFPVFYVNGERQEIRDSEYYETPLNEYLTNELGIEFLYELEDDHDDRKFSQFTVLAQTLDEIDFFHLFHFDSSTRPIRTLFGTSIMTGEGVEENVLWQDLKSMGESFGRFCDIATTIELYKWEWKKVNERNEMSLFSIQGMADYVEKIAEFLKRPVDDLLDLQFPDFPQDLHSELRIEPEKEIYTPAPEEIFEVEDSDRTLHLFKLMYRPTNFIFREPRNTFPTQEENLVRWNEYYQPKGKIQYGLDEINEEMNRKIGIGVGLPQDIPWVSAVSLVTPEAVAKYSDFDIQKNEDLVGEGFTVLGDVEEGGAVFFDPSLAVDSTKLEDYYRKCLDQVVESQGSSIALYVGEHDHSDKDNKDEVVMIVREYLEEMENLEDLDLILFCLEEYELVIEALHWALVEAFPKEVLPHIEISI